MLTYRHHKKTRRYSHQYILQSLVESSWNVMAHFDAREGKWRVNWRMELVASTLPTTSEHGVSSITTADVHTSAASSRLNWRTRPILNGLVRFGERRNLVSARVPSHLKRSLLRAVIILFVGHQTAEFMIITILKLTL